MTAARSDIARNYRVLQSLVDGAEELASRGQFEAAAVGAQVAAEFASRNHPGTFASPRLEDLLARIARHALRDDPGPPAAGSPAAPARVMHVLTQAHAKGGHSRLAWRWIANDTRRIHSVALTGQGDIPVPQAMLDAVEASGGEVRRIDRESPRLLGRASALRRAAGSFGHVVLHVHPFDVVPVLAFADAARRPKVLFMNHADHLFWIGASVLDRLLVFREAGRQLAIERRSVPPQRCSMVPVPIEVPLRTRTREEARAAIGVEKDCVLGITVAFSYKFGTSEGATHLADAVLPVFEQHLRARLVAIGPAQAGPWKRAHARLAGRISAVGERGDTRAYFEAADIFLMPMPVASTTAALEAGSHGLPILELREGEGPAGVLDAGSPGLSVPAVVRARGLDEYRARLAQLLEDAGARVAAGAAAREAILVAHASDAWLEQVDLAFSAADAGAPREAAPAPEPSPLFTPTDVALGQMRPGLLAHLGFILARQSKSLTLGARVGLFFSRLGLAAAFSPRYFALELALVLVSRRQMELLRTASENTGWFRRYFDK